ncbi:hypothetical protein AB0B45_14800 [Nonomuraea sp. NPDC049152]|uniref:hypothetical protein n=1 Tax=Nonomuraea sp. NPDC049152 TaxID=3154350 RepID=UPI00340014F0
MKRVLLAPLASAVLALVAPAAPAATAASTVVHVGEWVSPHLTVHASPGSVVHEPGRILGNMLPSWDASAECYFDRGAALNLWGRHHKVWVKIKWGWTGYAWVWAGGLRSHAGLPFCTP